MKKSYLLGVLSLFMAAPLVAQEETKPRFEPGKYWFVEAKAGVGGTAGETYFENLLSPNFGLAIGYSFNPIIATRLEMTGFTGKGGWSTLWNTKYTERSYSFNYIQPSLDAMLNLTNAFCGYREDRRFNFVTIIGVGYGRSFNFDEDDRLPEHPDAINSVVARLGAQAKWSLNHRWDIGAEFMANAYNDTYTVKMRGKNDFHYNLFATVGYKFGHRDYVDPCESAYDKVKSLNDMINTQREEIAQLRNDLSKKPKTVDRVVEKTVKVIDAYVPFKINSAVLDPIQEVQLHRIAEYLKENPNAKVKLTGYADAKTGNAKINERLAKKRAEAIAKGLTERHGVSSSSLTIESLGDTVQPFATNEWNRVVILITE